MKTTTTRNDETAALEAEIENAVAADEKAAAAAAKAAEVEAVRAAASAEVAVLDVLAAVPSGMTADATKIALGYRLGAAAVRVPAALGALVETGEVELVDGVYVLAGARPDPMAAARAHHWTRRAGDRWVFDAEKAVEEFAGARVVDGVVRWESNGNVPPAKVVSDFLAVGVIDAATAEATEAARKAETAAFLDAYRRNPPPVSDELRAEFGPDANVVDVITGRRVRL